MTDETNPVIVERVARALATFEGRNPDAASHREGKPVWTYYIGQAQAALEAMPSLVELREALEAVSNHILAEPSIKQIARTALATVRDVGGGV